jgi:hypothetical protein
MRNLYVVSVDLPNKPQFDISHKPVSREFAREWQFDGLATIRSCGFPPRNAPNSTERPACYLGDDGRFVCERGHHVHILEMNGESCRLKQSKRKRGSHPNS